MDVNDRPLVVIGSGISGYTVIRQFREHERQHPVALVTADGGEVYSKPLLSNALAKQQTPESMVQKSGEDKARELGVKLISNCSVYDIDAPRRVLNTSRGVLAYDSLVLATGARQRLILPDGADRDWVHTVNSLEDYRLWYGRLAEANSVLLIGAGLIGCEFADDLISRGIRVHVVDIAPWPLSRLVPSRLGHVVADALADNGATLHLGCSVERLARGDSGYTATLSGGTVVHVDLVLSSVGLEPETALAHSAGLEVDKGVVVDDCLRTSNRYIYALGDCAQTAAGLLPYILPIMAQARVLGQVLAGKDVRLVMKAMPVMVKTTSIPLVVSPPRVGAPGNWRVEGTGRDLSAIFDDPQGRPIGFAVSGAALSGKAALAKKMPNLVGG